MLKELSIGLDLGTSVIKGVVIDQQGKVVSSYQLEHETTIPKPGMAEQDPLGWWENAKTILNKITSDVNPKSIDSIGLSGQMHGTVVYGGDGNLLRSAVPWLDQRSKVQVERLRKKVGDAEIYRITGNPMSTGFLLPTLMHLFENEPEVMIRTTDVSLPKDFLAKNLTGSNVKTEPTDALATGAFDYQQNVWSTPIIERAGLPREIFPDVQSTDEAFGVISEEAAKATGLSKGIPVYGGSDQSMAAIGNGLIEDGQAVLSVSTGGQFIVVAPKNILDKGRRLHTLNHAAKEKGLYMAATLSAGLSLRWLKNEVFNSPNMSYEEFLKGVEDIPPGSEGLIFLPFLLGERTPYFNPDLKGGFFGLTLQHNRLHMARAIMEGVAFSMKQCFEVFKDLGIPINELIISGGGSKSFVWRQIITDVLGIPTKQLNIEDHSPFGAAVWARFAANGLDKMPDFLTKTIKTVDIVQPNRTLTDSYERDYEKYKRLADEMNRM